MNYIEAVLYTFIIGGAAVELAVNILNVKNMQVNLPQPFVGYYDEEKYARSQEYLRAKTRLEIVETLITTPILLLFIASGGFNLVDNFARGWGFETVATGLIFSAVLLLLGKVISTPFSLYSHFVIEEKFGFNRMSFKTYIIDQIKGLFLGAILGAPLLSLIFWFFESAGPNAWIWSWVAVTLFQLFVMFLAPAFIFPLFNKFTPLEDGELKSAIESYARSQNFLLQGIFKMDGSKRSTKANAYFTGFGRFRRVVLFDTLIAKHTTEELVAILAHEIGHFKRRHILKQLVLGILTTGLMFYMLSLFLNNPTLFEAFKMEHVSVYASIVFFMFLYSPISMVLSLFSLHLSRKFEFEADHYSLTTFPRNGVLAQALKKLTVENLGNLTPHPLAVFLKYTHPPILDRLKKMEA